MNSSNAAVFLDRDGVLTKLIDRRPAWNLKELEYYEFAKKLITTIRARGYMPVVVTNQPDAARGSVTFDSIKSVENAVKEQLGLRYYYACYHAYDGECNCRKPCPGLLHSASAELNISLSSSYLIGDREKDIIAGLACNCKTILFNSSHSDGSTRAFVQPDYTCPDYRSLDSLLRSLL